MRLLAIAILVVAPGVAAARDLPKPAGPRDPPCEKIYDPAVRCTGVKHSPPPPKTITIGPLAIAGRVRTISMLELVERATEELQRAALEKRSFVPKLVQSVDEESL